MRQVGIERKDRYKAMKVLKENLTKAQERMKFYARQKREKIKYSGIGLD